MAAAFNSRLLVLLVLCGDTLACDPTEDTLGDASGDASSDASSDASGELCADTSLGVCEIADAGIEHIPLSRGGANGLAVDSATGFVYIVINGSTSIWCGGDTEYEPGLSIVNASIGEETAIVPTAEGPVWPLVDVPRNRVYVAGSGGEGTVAVHDPTSGAIEDVFVLGGMPHDMGVDPLGSSLLVSNTFDESQTFVSVLNLETGSVEANIQVPALPHKVVVDDSERVGYVVSLGAGAISSVDLESGELVGTLSSGPIPQTSGMVFSPSRRILYVGKTGVATPGSGSTIVAVDVDSGEIVGEAGTFTPGSPESTRPWGLALDDANGLIYAAMGNTSLVAVVDVETMTPVAVFEVDACPWAVALDMARGVGYVASNLSPALTVFDLGRVMTAIGR